jgi:hypothetical protein
VILALLSAALLSSGPRPVVADSLDAIKHVSYVLSQYYPLGREFRSVERSLLATRRRTDVSDMQPGVRCDADRGDVCFAGDTDAGPCPDFVQCHMDPERMVRVLVEESRAHPATGFLGGQAVYALVKMLRLPEALKLAGDCAAAPWWCGALKGYVLHFLGRDIEADTVLRGALHAAPDSVACAWSDATWLLGELDQRGSPQSTVDAHERAGDWGCARRLAWSDSLWWLADPLYSVPGNDRWVEHVARAMSSRFSLEIRRTHSGSPGSPRVLEHLWATRLRRGDVDSYESGRSVTWTSRSSARYHFVPDVALDGLEEPAWRLDAHLDDEGYAPSWGPVLPLPQQTARFRGEGGMRVAAAARVEGTPLARALDASATFALSSGPAAPPVLLSGDPRQGTVRFLGSAPAGGYVASTEVVTSRGVGWERHALPPLPARGAGLSDLLLYEPSGEAGPNDVVSAAAGMLGSTGVPRGASLGVYWETYGVEAATTLSFDLAVERRSGGLVDRLRRLLPGGAQEGRGRVTWTETAEPGSHASAIDLDLGDLDDGSYTLVLRVSWPGHPPVERRRDITVE